MFMLARFPQEEMKVTQAGEYGLLALLHLGRQPEGCLVMADEISRQEKIPKEFLVKILQTLVRAGIVRSRPGAKGGFSLARHPEEITLLEALEAIEGRTTFLRRRDEEPADCAHLNPCKLCVVFTEAQNRVADVFRQISLAEMMRPLDDVIDLVQTMPLGTSPTALEDQFGARRKRQTDTERSAAKAVTH